MVRDIKRLYNIYNSLLCIWGFPNSSDSKECSCSVENAGFIPGLGRSSGEGNVNTLQYSCQENSKQEFHGQRSLEQSMGLQRIEHD